VHDDTLTVLDGAHELTPGRGAGAKRMEEADRFTSAPTADDYDAEQP
jgi:hypothetical protein